MTNEKKAAMERFVRLCTPLGPVRGKAMFGGYGVYCDDLMFALITRQGEIFLKADGETRGSFDAAGLRQFGKMPYFQAPSDALESWAALEPWATASLAAARRTRKPRRATARNASG